MILGSALDDVPERYRDPERAAQLVSVVADATHPDGIVVVPAGEREVQRRVREAGRRVSVFAVEGGAPPVLDGLKAHEVATARHGRVVVERDECSEDAGPLLPTPSAAAQLAALLALRAVAGSRSTPSQ